MFRQLSTPRTRSHRLDDDNSSLRAIEAAALQCTFSVSRSDIIAPTTTASIRKLKTRKTRERIPTSCLYVYRYIFHSLLLPRQFFFLSSTILLSVFLFSLFFSLSLWAAVLCSVMQNCIVQRTAARERFVCACGFAYFVR